MARKRIDTPPLTFEVRRDLPNTADISAIPHNALEDAKSLRLAGMMHNAEYDQWKRANVEVTGE